MARWCGSLLTVIVSTCLTQSLATQFAPTGLLCNFQKSPALGVSPTSLSFSWITAPDASVANVIQYAYSVSVKNDMGETIWSSGKVVSSQSINVPYPANAPALAYGAVYSWTVTTWSRDGATPSASSSSAIFATAHAPEWPKAQYIQGNGSTYALFRKVVNISGEVQNAIIYISAASNDETLCAFKLHVNGKLVAVGPGRPEAPVTSGDGRFRKNPYVTILIPPGQLTKGSNLVAVGSVHNEPQLLVELVVRYKTTSSAFSTLTVGTGPDWMYREADSYYRPTPANGGKGLLESGTESIDANYEPLGWASAINLANTEAAKWSHAVVCPNCSEASSSLSPTQRHARMAHPIQIIDLPTQAMVPFSGHDNHTRVTCGFHPESRDDKSTLTLRCGHGDGDTSGGVIDKIIFADFGTPDGTCSGWTNGHFTANHSCSCQSSTEASVRALCLNRTSCTIDSISPGTFCINGTDPCANVHKHLSILAHCSKPAPPPTPHSPRFYYVDFQREFQGGLRLHVANGVKGTRVHITSGELMDPITKALGNTWGYDFEWTLRDGQQTLEQHKYMEFRYLNIEVIPPETDTDAFSAGKGIIDQGISVSAWMVQQEWDPTDTSFNSSSSLLNKVWELSRYTLQAGVLDTYTDSNTRERRPYEADGLIAATARLMVQRDPMWARHSHSYVIQTPTWPAEWQQMSNHLAWLDFQTTNTTDLFRAYESTLFKNTLIEHLDPNGTGLVWTGWPGNRHIIGWDPWQHSDVFKQSQFQFICNAFATRALHTLGVLANHTAGSGYATNASKYAKMSSDLRAAMMRKMWDGGAGRFCDGVCDDPRVSGFGGPYTQTYSLYLGLVPPAFTPGVWESVVNWTQPGASNYGDYGAFAVQYALTDYELFGPGEGGGVESNGGGDDGEAVLNFLTKCDSDSWCTEFSKYNATMTGEGFNNGQGTRSHPWGTSAIPAVVQGVMGVQRMAPAYSVFKVKPRLANLTQASLRLPTLMGHIEVSVVVTPQRYRVSVAPPCNTIASVCVPLSAVKSGSKTKTLLLNGEETAAVVDGRHLCVRDVGCGKSGLAQIVENVV